MREKIAIVGISSLFPGSKTSEEFWENLVQKKDLIKMASEEDFGVDPAIFYKEGKGKKDQCYSLRGGYIRDFDFDPSGYLLEAGQLNKLDKLYQWPLHVCREALSDAGYRIGDPALQNCGLILGNLSFPTSTSQKVLSGLYAKGIEGALQELLDEKDFKVPHLKSDTHLGELLMHTPSGIVEKAIGSRWRTLLSRCSLRDLAICHQTGLR